LLLAILLALAVLMLYLLLAAREQSQVKVVACIYRVVLVLKAQVVALRSTAVLGEAVLEGQL
jgi:hypothetical protein